MGKSIRSKIKKRLRTVKRQRVDAMIITPREHEKHEKLLKVAQGRAVTMSTPKNAFKYPDNDDAAFPQHEVMKPIDFRAQNLPMAGTAFRGNRRKYSPEEAEMMKNIIKTSHPKMEILAGGGMVLAKSGRKVSREEAEFIATKVNRPEAAAVVEQAAVPAAASTAPAASAPALEEDEDMELEESPAPEGSADTSRRPVLKDARRAKRTAEGRSRPNSVKKGANKQKSQEAAAPQVEVTKETTPTGKKGKKS
eukprot:TRINITY_DN103668_c0_g1_i1.p1 TRINITY_DN103668_c0_g1~~TRINITY_DN103668_c0_g1_i1.p1  ORF type:complete len:251 (+),score=66.97 TRINITY_DN103668_c0_g1_i1:72-824(+)